MLSENALAAYVGLPAGCVALLPGQLVQVTPDHSRRATVRATTPANPVPDYFAAADVAMRMIGQR